MTEYILHPFSLVFRLIVQVRKRLYASGLLHRTPLHCPSVCVGNITAGGTGKTPVCIFLMKHFIGAGKNPVLLLRGYKGADGTCDEAEIYKKRIKDCAIGIGADRHKSAANHSDADIAIMDDGLQHLSVRPTVTVAVIDCLNPFSNGMLLPAGRLREPVHGLQEYDMIVLSRANLISQDRLTWLHNRLGRICPDTPCFESAQKINAFRDPFSLEMITPDIPAEKKALAFCGIGNPESFRRSLNEIGISPTDLLAYSDHHTYTQQDADHIQNTAARQNADVILTTEKDINKIAPFFRDNQDIRLCYSVLDIEFNDPESFTGHITRLLDDRKVLK